MPSYNSPARKAQAAATRRRILEALASELESGGLADLSMSRVAARAGVAERTVYRHFENREGLTAALADLVNEQLGDLPEGFPAEELAPRMATLFASFEADAPLVRGVLASPGGQEVRAHARARRLQRIDAALAPRLATAADPEHARDVRALVFLLCSAATWQSLRDEGGLEGAEAGRAVAFAIDTLLETLSP